MYAGDALLYAGYAAAGVYVSQPVSRFVLRRPAEVPGWATLRAHRPLEIPFRCKYSF